jgi:phage tail protein X
MRNFARFSSVRALAVRSFDPGWPAATKSTGGSKAVDWVAANHYIQHNGYIDACFAVGHGVTAIQVVSPFNYLLSNIPHASGMDIAAGMPPSPPVMT